MLAPTPSHLLLVPAAVQTTRKTPCIMAVFLATLPPEASWHTLTVQVCLQKQNNNIPWSSKEFSFLTGVNDIELYTICSVLLIKTYL